MKNILAACFVLLVVSVGKAQQTVNLDSLMSLLDEPAHDTAHGDIMLKVSNAYLQINLDTSFLFSSKAHELYERQNHMEGMAHASNLQAIVYARQRKFDEAIHYFEIALSKFRAAGNRERELRTLSNLATAEHDRGEYQNANRYFEEIDKLFQEVDDSAGRAVNYFNWARTLIAVNELGQGEEYLILASDLNNEATDWLTTCRIYSMLGQLSYTRGNLSEAEEYSLKVLEVVRDREAPLIEAQAYQLMGMLKLDRGQIQPAIEQYMKANRGYEQGGRIDGVISCKIGLGNIYLVLTQYNVAKAFYEEALTLAEEIGDQRSASIAVSNLGEIMIMLGDYDQGRAYMMRMLDYWRDHSSDLEIAKTHSSLARIELKRGQLGQAILFNDTAISILENTGHHEPLATAYRTRGEIFREQGLFAQSSQCFEEMVKNARKVNALKSVRDYYYESGLLYTRMKEFENAAYHYQRYIELNDSLFTSSISENAGKYEAMYWSEKKQHDLEISRKNEELKTQEALAAQLERDRITSQRNYIVLGATLVLIFSFFFYRFYNARRRSEVQKQLSDLELKALRAQINPHFLFNALSGVQNMIDKNEMRSASTSLAKCAKLTRLILEHSEKDSVSLASELLSIRMYIELEALRFSFRHELTVDPYIDQEAVELPSMLVQPFIENAIIHGIATKRSEGFLKVDVSLVRDGVLFVVEDNGVGRSKPESTKANHKPMGMKISSDRINKLHGNEEFDIESIVTDLTDEQGNPTGTRVEILIPGKDLAL